MESGYPAWTSSSAQQIRSRSHLASSWPRSSRSWRTITHLRNSTCTFPTTGARSSLSMLCGRLPPSQSIGFHSARDATLSQGHLPLTLQSHCHIRLWFEHPRRMVIRQGVHAYFNIFRQNIRSQMPNKLTDGLMCRACMKKWQSALIPLSNQLMFLKNSEQIIMDFLNEIQGLTQKITNQLFRYLS